jgi:hypothetical protein
MRGGAAVSIWCDVQPEARDEFDDWHVHEHMPERLRIPGFLRGSRWISADGNQGHFMLYEARELATITSGPYLERLNNPTPWSRKMMPHHQNVVRSLCLVQSSHGSGLGPVLLTLRFSPVPGEGGMLGEWLSKELLPRLPERKGLVAAHLLRAVPGPEGEPTTEQKIRGGDASADWVVLVNGYSEDAVRALAASELGASTMTAKGVAPDPIAGVYTLAYSLTAEDVARRS